MATTSTSTAATTPPSPGSATTRINSDQKRKTCESKAPTEVCPICSCKFLRPEIEVSNLILFFLFICLF